MASDICRVLRAFIYSLGVAVDSICSSKPVVKKDITLKVVDSQSNKPISEATVELAGKSAKTDSEGRATFNSIGVGSVEATITKKYYDYRGYGYGYGGL